MYQNTSRYTTVPPREGEGRLSTSSSEGTLHHIRSLQILFPLTMKNTSQIFSTSNVVKGTTNCMPKR